MNSEAIPHNLEAEVGVLGTMLVEEDTVGEIVPLLDKSHFFSSAHQIIFEVIAYLFDNNQVIGPISVQEELIKRGVAEQVGGHNYLVSLMETVFSGSNAVHYAHIVREKGIMRQLIQVANKIGEEAKSGRLDLDTLLDHSEKLVFEITQKKISSEPCHVNRLLVDILADIEKGAYGVCDGVPSGYADLDKMIAGLQNSCLIIVAGRPSMGKTSFALNVASHAAVNVQTGVLIFSLEMSKEQLAQNLLCSRAGISPHKIRSGEIEHEDYKRITEEIGCLGNAPVYIDDSPALSLRELRAKARRLKSRYNVGLIVVDYIQLIEGSGDKRSENRQQEISQISRGLKGLARELNIPVIALSQLNRSVDARDDHRPRMSDLRESGALEQDADLILFLYRDEYYNKESPKQGIAEVIVAKHRNGPVGSVELAFIKEYMRFLCLAQRAKLSYGSQKVAF